MSQKPIIFVSAEMLASLILMKWWLLFGTRNSASLYLQYLWPVYTQEKSLLLSDTQDEILQNIKLQHSFYLAMSKHYVFYQQVTYQKVSYQTNDLEYW